MTERFLDNLTIANKLNLAMIASPPSQPVEGTIYYNTVNDYIEVFTNSIWRQLSYLGQPNAFARNINLAQSGGDYTTLTAAINAAIAMTPTASNYVQIRVFPGTYTINNPVTIPSFVLVSSIADMSKDLVIFNAANSGSNHIILSVDSSIDGIRLRGGTTALTITGVGTTRVSDCTLSNCTTGISVSGAGVFAFVNNTVVLAETSPITNGMIANAGGLLWATDCIARVISGSITNAYVVQNQSRAFLEDCSSLTLTNSFSVNTNGILNVQGGKTLNCFRGAIINSATCNMVSHIIGYDVIPVGALSLELQNDTSIFYGTSNRINHDLISRTPNSTFKCSMFSNRLNDEGFEVRGNLQVGDVFTPSKSAFGSGRPHNIGMRVFTATANGGDGTAFVDVTTQAITPNSTFVGFAATAVGRMLLIGGQHAAFSGVQMNITAGAVPIGARTLVGTTDVSSIACEYWNGSAWVTTVTMASQSNPPHITESISLFLAGDYQYRFGTSAMALKTINGVNAYWVRFRITTALTTVPTIDTVFLHSNCMNVRIDGFTELFGAAQRRILIPYDINLAKPAGGAPNDQDIYLSTTMGIGYTANSFASLLATDNLGFVIEPPNNMDTSKGIRLLIRYFVTGITLLSSFDIRIRMAKVSDFVDDTSNRSTLYTSAPGNAAAAGSLYDQTFTINVVPGENNKMKSLLINMDVSSVITKRNAGSTVSDLLYVHISRGLTIFGGPFVVVSLQPSYVAWSDGGNI